MIRRLLPLLLGKVVSADQSRDLRADADCGDDYTNNFPVNLMGTQVFGLSEQSGGSIADCARRCCNDAACNVFSFCPASSLACGQQGNVSKCATGAGTRAGNCSTGGGAIWCNWYTFARAGAGIASPYPNCTLVAPPTPPTMAVPPRLPTGVPGATGRAGDGWGVNFHANEASGPAEYDIAAAAFRVVRLDLSWGSVEKRSGGGCGTYSFDAYDAADAEWRARGVQPLYILDYWSECYDGGTGCSSAACIDAYGNFGAAAMRHFPGAIHECQNEPQGPPFWPGSNATVLALMCYAVRAKAAAAGALSYWTGPTTSWFDYVWLTAALEACIANAFHAWSIHPYTGGAPEVRMHDMAELAEYVRLASGGGPQRLQVLSSEWGYTSCGPGECADETNVLHTVQGKYLARMMLSQTLFGAPYSIWYDFKDDPYGVNSTESHFGTVNGTLHPKPPYLAALTLQRGVGNGTFIGRVTPRAPSPDVFILRFDGARAGAPNASAFAVWTNATTCVAAVADRAPCPGVPGGGLDACIAAGCCFDEGAAGPQCFETPASRAPARTTFDVGGADAVRCFDVTDVFGFARGRVCAVDGALTVNVTDGPSYFT